MKFKTILYGLGLVFGLAILIALTYEKPIKPELAPAPVQYIN
jgi:hypothetical protein